MSSKRRLRKDTIEYLEVKEELSLPLRVLPQGVDVLCLMLGRKRKKEAVNIDFPVSCPRIPGTFELKCYKSDGCRVKSEPTKWCVVRRREDFIKNHLQALFPAYHDKVEIEIRADKKRTK